MAQLNFNAQGVDTTSQFDAIPAGDYEAMVTDSEMKSTKDGQGQYLQMTIEIQNGPHQGRRMFDRLNLQNRNPKAVEIAQKQLAQLCHATGVMQLQDSQQLHNIPVIMKVSAKNDPERGMQNEVKGYKARIAAAAVQAFTPTAPRAAAPAAVAPAAAAPRAAPPPWAKQA